MSMNYTQLAKDISQTKPRTAAEAKEFWYVLCDFCESAKTPAIQSAAQALKDAIQAEYFQDFYIDPSIVEGIQRACSSLSFLDENGHSLFK